MADLSELARRLMAETQDPKARAAMGKVIENLQTTTNKQAAPNVSADCAKRIEQAAKAAQRGDKATAMAVVSELLATNEGSALAKRLQFLIGKQKE